MCDHVVELGTESPGMCFGAAADEMMLGWDDAGDKICGAARQKTGSAAVTSHYRCRTLESSMGICGSEQGVCLNVEGVYELEVMGFVIQFNS